MVRTRSRLGKTRRRFRLFHLRGQDPKSGGGAGADRTPPVIPSARVSGLGLRVTQQEAVIRRDGPVAARTRRGAIGMAAEAAHIVHLMKGFDHGIHQGLRAWHADREWNAVPRDRLGIGPGYREA